MELAQAILRLWERRRWVAGGIVVAIAIGMASTMAFRSTVYASASTQLVVDAPRSALGNLQTSLVPFTNRAIVYSRLMTSPQALAAIGNAAGIPGNEIEAQGPAEIGAPQATHVPSATVNGKLVTPRAKYVLRFDQNPQLPTIDIYAQAPTYHQAAALANGAVTGLRTYLSQLDTNTGVPDGQRIEIRQLGAAQGGVVDLGTPVQIAGIIGFVVLLLWCVGVLYLTGMRARLRKARIASEPLEGVHSPRPERPGARRRHADGDHAEDPLVAREAASPNGAKAYAAHEG